MGKKMHIQKETSFGKKCENCKWKTTNLDQRHTSFFQLRFSVVADLRTEPDSLSNNVHIILDPGARVHRSFLEDTPLVNVASAFAI